MNKKENLLCTFIIVTTCFVLAVFIPNISDAMTVIGATSNPAVGFCLPIVFWLKSDQSPKFSAKRVIAHIVNILVICVGIISLILFIISKTK